MNLRSGTVVGAHILRPEHRPAFEEGVRQLFMRWTALCLAMENQWGGHGSADKGAALMQEVLRWFYGKKGVYRHGVCVCAACDEAGGEAQNMTQQDS